MKRMPAIFIGHGSPMIALEHDKLTDAIRSVGDAVISEFGEPKAILAISGHWYKRGTFVQETENPEQIFDMYGFPEALYKIDYKPKGCRELSKDVLSIAGLGATVDNSWGIDHGTWAPLVHMFPKADVPVVQLSVNAMLSSKEIYEIGEKLSSLRDKGYLVFGSGNVVHNLREVDWNNQRGSMEAEEFDTYIKDNIEKRNDLAVVNYASHKRMQYAVPTPDHFYPLLYVLGASEGEKADVFNQECQLSAISMTSYAFGLK